MKKVQRPFCPPPAKNTIIVFFAIAFFNMLDPLVHAQTLTLTPSNYNGNNISCFGAQDGSINLTISGVTPPYTIRWSNDATTEDLSNLPAGYYNVEVDDTIPSTEALQAEITLTEPEALGVELTVSDYLVNARHYTISLNGACNGSITPSVGGGTAPYTYNWEPYGQTTANLTNICAGDYNLNVTDANGCAAPAQQDMTEPDRDDWQMNGNTGTNPATQFIGTVDNQDFSLRTYNQERLRIKANGELKINSLAGTGDRDLFVTANGIIQAKPIAYWTITGNAAIDETQHFIGPLNNQDFIFKTGDATNGTFKEKMRISKGTEISFFNGTSSQYDNDQFQIIQTPVGNPTGIHPARRGILIDKDPGGLFNFYIHSWKTDAAFNFNLIDANNNNTIVNLMSISKNGCVGIGVSPTANNASAYKLVVGGKVGVKDDVYVTSNTVWPDYVSYKDYKLPPLSDIVNYFKEHNHFEGFPTAKEIETGGQPVATIQNKQQEKLEQAYLYLIKHDQRLEALEKQNALLKKQNELLLKRIEMLEK
jgi:hypothetical protein